ncbi:glycosyltransferase family 41 protein [Magnetospirillum sp. SS-4]|uniref:tetratricopeptide repeat protein n=1 Tax=Magnetospirillum sp. SS-4 TaxID=2681465 RepID=UPI0015746A96|nr:glycosyltransferase family 41 protein [Magnetospirillum sp. SS-4]
METASVVTVDEALRQAVEHHRAGRMAEAERIYRAILEQVPHHPDANHNLGLIAVHFGKAEPALPYLRAAVAARPGAAAFHAGLANALMVLGRVDEAESCHRQALAIDPDLPDANVALGHVEQNRGRTDEAVALYRRAIAVRPDFAEPLMFLGIIHQDRGELDEAIALYRRAIAAAPGFTLAHYNLGLALHAQNRLDEAIDALRRAVELKPDFAEALNLMGGTLWALGRYRDSIDCYDRILEFRPDFAKGYHNKGNSLRDMGRPEEALACFQRALDIDPNLAEPLNSMGRTLEDLGRLDDALDCYRRAAALRPDLSETRNNMGNVLMGTGRYDEAVIHYLDAVDLNLKSASAHRNLLSAILFHPGWTLERRYAEHRRFEDLHARPHYPSTVSFANPPDPDRRLRVGYLSSDFRGHSVARNLLPLVHAHDRGRVELFFYANVNRPDAQTLEFQGLADGWRSVVGHDDRQIAEVMRADSIDILVVLAGRFDNNRPLVAAYRPAPVQISFHDPATSGLEVMDAIITDPVLTPRHGRERFAERPIRLPSFYLHAPIDNAPPVTPPPMLRNGYPTLGSFNSPAKLSRDTLVLWAEVMRRLPTARLALKYRNLMSTPSIGARIIAIMAEHGVEAERIELLGSVDGVAEHLALYDRIDVALDPFPFNGSTTTFEALWMGVPVVTLPGEAMLGRWTASILTPLKLTGLIAASSAGYVDICERLCADSDGLTALRSGLRDRIVASPLCDAKAKARHMERIYRALWRRWCATRNRRP